MFKYLSLALAALCFQNAAAFTPPGCEDEDCVIVSVVLCGDPHLKDFAQDMYDITGECMDVVLMDNQNYDELGNDYFMTADIMALSPDVSVVSKVDLTIGPDSLVVMKDNTMSTGSGEISAAGGVGPSDIGGIPYEVTEFEDTATEGRALAIGGVYIEILIFVGEGVIIVISTEFGVLCIKIVGPSSKISILVGIFNSDGRRALEESEQTNLRAISAGDDKNARRQLAPTLTEGCTATLMSRRRNLKVTNDSRELLGKACSTVTGKDMEICASLEE